MARYTKTYQIQQLEIKLRNLEAVVDEKNKLLGDIKDALWGKEERSYRLTTESGYPYSRGKGDKDIVYEINQLRLQLSKIEGAEISSRNALSDEVKWLRGLMEAITIPNKNFKEGRPRPMVNQLASKIDFQPYENK